MGLGGTGNRQPEIPALTGLRFFAAFFILFAHAADWLGQFNDSNIRTHFTVPALYGMPLFFVLSGFVIHYNYRRLFASKSLAQATCEFAGARFARLFPLYFCFLLVAIVADNFLLELIHRPEAIKKALLYYVTLTQSWTYVAFDGKTMLSFLFGLSWSISTEMFFYTAYIPTVFLLLTIRSTRTAFATAAIYAVTITLMLLFARYHRDGFLAIARYFVQPGAVEGGFDQSFYRWFFYYSPYVRVWEFFIGCLAAQAFVLLQDRPVSSAEHRLGGAALVAALTILVLQGLLYIGIPSIEPVNGYIRHLALNFLCAPAISVVLFCVSRYDTKFARFMSLPALVALGDTSYSIYVVHTWTLRIFYHPATQLDFFWGVVAIFRALIAIALTLVVAYATYRLIEVPARTWLRVVFARWTAALFGNRIAAVPPASSHAHGVPVSEPTQAKYG
jgi:peptidoglycan/LPS O-acetylase OafA/YrhL